MNYRTRFERLRERFLRVNSGALLESACVEGGLILKQYFSDGAIIGNPELTNFYVDYLNAADDTRDELVAEFTLSSGFKLLARAASEDPNILALKEVSRDNGITFLLTKPDSHNEQAERYAAFCLELVGTLKQVDERGLKKYPGLTEIFREDQANPKLSKSEKTYRKVAERYWKSLDRNDRPTVEELKRWLERVGNH